MKTIRALLSWLYQLMMRPAAKIGLGVLVVGGFAAGALFWHTFQYALQATNEESFCLSCHTMHDNLLPELKRTVHWQNRSGVRAHCPDCHVPHDFTDKIARKMQASREVLGQLIGTIGTREKFLDHRLTLAQREWERFRANSSKECRNCHDYADMDFDKMRVTSQMIMRSAAERDASCVDCHKGIAHQLPEMSGASNPAFDSLVSEAQSVRASAGNTFYSVVPQELYADEGLSQVIGSLEVAGPAKVIAVKDKAVQIELDMWRKNKGFARVLYPHFGLNITSAILNKEAAADSNIVKVAETREDDLTGLEWQEVKVQAWIKSGWLLDRLEPIWDVARHSYTQGCSVCHRQPAEAGHDANEWTGLFAGMVGFTNMDKDTAALVLKYLQLHSSNFAKGTHASGSPEQAVQTAKP